MTAWRHVGRLAAWGAAYAGAVAWLAWPLPSYLGTRLAYATYAAAFDLLHAGWALAWETHALVTPSVAVANANIFHPASAALFYGPTAFGALPIFAPVFLATGNPSVATNLTFLLGVVLTAVGVHGVVWRWTRSEAAAAVAGAQFVTHRFLWTFVATAPQYAVLAYLPWVIFIAAAPLRAGRAVVLFVLVGLQAAVEPVYVAPALFLPLTLLALARTARTKTRRDGVALLGVLAAVIVVLVPLYAGYVRVWRANPRLSLQTPWPWAPLEQFLHPATVSWSGVAGLGTTDVSSVVLAVIVVGAVCATVVRRDLGSEARAAWRHAAFWTVIGFILATKVIVFFFGTPIPLPHYRLARTFFPRATAIARVPARYGVIALVGIPLLAGLGVAGWGALATRTAGRSAGRVVRVALAVPLCVLLFANRSGRRDAFPTFPSPALDVAVLRALRAGRGPVIELPVEPMHQARMTAIARQHAVAMYRSIQHWRPLVNGYSSYWPDGFPERVALAAALPDASALAALCAATGVVAVVVRVGELSPESRATWLALADAGGRPDLRLVARGEHDLLFETDAAR